MSSEAKGQAGSKPPNRLRWIFPLSGSPHPREIFFAFYSLPIGLLAWGAGMTSNYAVVQWLFVLAGVSAVGLMYNSFVVLTPIARKFWTFAFAIILGTSLIIFYNFLCPTVSIRPPRVVFGALPLERNVDLNQTYYFRIENETDEDLYSVRFDLQVEDTSLSSKDFDFDVPISSQIPLNENSYVGQMYADIWGPNCIDLKGHTIFVRIFNHLKPHESRQVKLSRIDASSNGIPVAQSPPHITIPSDSNGARVSARIVSFSKTDSASMETNKSQYTEVKIERSLVCGSSGFIRLK